ncbi:MAG: hypothetical protein RLZ12_789 [Bacillota bacterium]|jgi:hypothetical protein
MFVVVCIYYWFSLTLAAYFGEAAVGLILLILFCTLIVYWLIEKIVGFYVVKRSKVISFKKVYIPGDLGIFFILMVGHK